MHSIGFEVNTNQLTIFCWILNFTIAQRGGKKQHVRTVISAVCWLFLKLIQLNVRIIRSDSWSSSTNGCECLILASVATQLNSFMHIFINRYWMKIITIFLLCHAYKSTVIVISWNLSTSHASNEMAINQVSETTEREKKKFLMTSTYRMVHMVNVCHLFERFT